MTAYDRPDAGLVDSDRDEARSARLHSLSVGDEHPPDCSCRPCLVERSGLSDAEIRGWDVSGERFASDTAEHRMTVLLDEGPYRHLRFQKPGTGMYWFEIVTWPGSLAVRGDMGNYVFARLTDMFEFFRGHAVNEQYWAEKMICGPAPMEYDVNQLKRLLTESIAETEDVEDDAERSRLGEAVKHEILLEERVEYSEDAAHEVVAGFHFPLNNGSSFRFYDTWEWRLKKYTVHFVWCLHAIVYAIEAYDATRVAHAGTTPGGTS